jgi:hypothetical protein
VYDHSAGVVKVGSHFDGFARRIDPVAIVKQAKRAKQFLIPREHAGKGRRHRPPLRQSLRQRQPLNFPQYRSQISESLRKRRPLNVRRHRSPVSQSLRHRPAPNVRSRTLSELAYGAGERLDS